MTIQKFLQSIPLKQCLFIFFIGLMLFPVSVQAASCVASVMYPSPEDYQDTGSCNYWSTCSIVDGRTYDTTSYPNVCVISCPDCAYSLTNPSYTPTCSIGYVTCPVPTPTVNIGFSFMMDKIKLFTQSLTQTLIHFVKRG